MKSYCAIATILLIALAMSVDLRAANSETFAITESGINNLQQANTTEAAAATSAATSNPCVATAGVFAATSDRQHCNWDIVAESLFLWRDNHAPSWIAGDFDVGVGPRVIVTRNVNENWNWEAEYFGVYDMTARGTQTGLLFVPSFIGFTEFGSQTTSLAEHFESQHRIESNLNNVELNAVRKWQSLSVLVGFRYLRFDETAQNDAVAEISNLGPLTMSSHTSSSAENNLFGGQLGLRWRQDTDRAFLEATGKAGVFGNAFQTSDRPQESETAFVGELGFSAGLHLSNTWSVRAGYNLLWINELALAPFEVITTSTPFHLTPADRVFLHGANVGLEAAW